MASYTDIAPKFSPYVAHQDTDLMLKVGIAKQAQYQQGYEKIQSSIDQIAGLDIYNDVDKQYLQGKLNNLGNKLTAVAAGDFSNFQLTNSISGLAKEIGNDKLVQNAVVSTARVRKEIGFMEDEVKKGKSSIANQDDLNYQVKQYAGSTTPGQVFNGKYSTYIDINKKMTEVLKSLQASGVEVDYLRDGKGNLMDVMKRMSSEGVSAAKIQNALMNTLTPDEYNQLRIDANYMYQRPDSANTAVIINKEYDKKLTERVKLVELLKVEQSQSTSDPGTYNKLGEAIKSHEEYIATVNNKRDSLLNAAATNPEKALTTIYTEGYITGFALDHSWEKTKINYLTNPEVEVNFKRQAATLAAATYNLAVQKEKFDQNMAIKKDAREERKTELEIKKLELEIGGEGENGNGTTTAPLPIGTPKGGDDSEILLNADEEIVSNLSAYNSAVLSYAKKYNLQPGQAAYRFRQYEDGNESAINIQDRTTVDNAIEANKQATILQNTIETVKEEVRNSPLYKSSMKNIENQLQEMPSFNLTLGNTVVKYSPEELLAIKVKANKWGTGDEEFTKKEKILVEASREKHALVGGENGRKLRSTILNLLDKYSPFVNAAGEVTNNYNKEVTSKLKERIPGLAPTVAGVLFPDSASSNAKNNFGTFVSVNASKYIEEIEGAQIGGSNSNFKKEDAELVQSWIASGDKADLTYLIERRGSNREIIVINGKGTPGEQRVRVPVDKSMIDKLPNTPNAPSAEYEQVQSAQFQSGKGTTINSKDPTKGYFPKSAMKNVKNIITNANLTAEEGNSSKQLISFNLKLPTGWVTTQVPAFFTMERAIGLIKTASDESIINAFLMDPTIDEETKKLIRNLNK